MVISGKEQLSDACVNKVRCSVALLTLQFMGVFVCHQELVGVVPCFKILSPEVV